MRRETDDLLIGTQGAGTGEEYHVGPGESEENASGGERDGGSVSAETGDMTVVRPRGEQAEPPGSTEECGKRGGTGGGAVNGRDNVEASAMENGVAGEGGVHKEAAR